MHNQIVWMLLYWVPAFMLVYMAAEVYLRHPRSALHRVSAAMLAVCSLWFVGSYARCMLSAELSLAISKYGVQLALLLAFAFGMHFNILLTKSFSSWPRPLVWTLCYVPIVLMYIVVTQTQSVFVGVTEVEGYRQEIYGPGYSLYLLAIFVYALLSLALLLCAARRTEQAEEKQKFLILFSGTLLMLLWVAGARIWAEMGWFHLWPKLGVFGSLFWTVAVRLTMTRYGLLPEHAHRYQVLFRLAPLGILLVDRRMNIREANPHAAAMFGMTVEQLQAATLDELLPETERERFKEEQQLHYRAGKKQSGTSVDMLTFDGTTITVTMDCDYIAVEGEQLQFVTLRDMTGWRRAELQIAQLAHYDVLTGLPNRALLLERIARQLEQAEQGKTKLAVLLLDLDRFKIINDSLGHTFGDEALREVAARLMAQTRGEHVVARLGGDEFAVLMPFVRHEDEAASLAEHIVESLKRPIIVAQKPYFITGSIGISMYPDSGSSPDQLMQRADIAMYRAKESGRNHWKLYTSEMNDKVSTRLNLETSLRSALRRDEFRLLYQPQVRLATGEIYGMESLLRWDSPQRGTVSPLSFIPVAEETGLIVPIGQFVLQEACRQNKEWQRRGYTPLVVSVNISARQFNQADFAEHVQRVLEETGLDPQYLCLEITESTAIHHIDHTIDMLRKLIALGIKVSIDDFGTGYSSLAFLKRFPLHTIKIDKSFIMDMHANDDDAAIVNAIIAMSHSMKLQVIAEGVETEQQRLALEKQGCDGIQGYLISPPVPPEKFQKFLDSPVDAPRTGNQEKPMK